MESLTIVESLETVAFIKCSFDDVCLAFGMPSTSTERASWYTRWHGRTFLISDGDKEPSFMREGECSFAISANDPDAGHGFALYAQDVISAARLTRGLIPV